MLPSGWHVQDEMLAAKSDEPPRAFWGTEVGKYNFKSDPRCSDPFSQRVFLLKSVRFLRRVVLLSDTRLQTLALISSIRGHHTQ